MSRPRLRVLLALLLQAWYPSRAAAPGPIERVTSELVLIEAYVTGPDGRPIRGLGPEHFILKVDGKPAPIRSLDFREMGPTRRIGTNADAAAPEPAISPPPRRFVIFFEDDISSAQGLTVARRAAKKFIASNLDPSDQVAIVTHGRTLRFLGDFADDRQALQHRLDATLDDRGRVSDFAMTLRRQEDDLRDVLEGRNGGGNVAQQAATMITDYAREDGVRLSGSLLALRSVVDALAPWPGYKAVVYMGDGLPQNPADYFVERLADYPVLSRVLGAHAEASGLASEFGALLDAAAAGDVTIDTIETGGLAAGDASRTRGSGFIRAASYRSNSLKSFALNTGGVASSSNDPLKGLVQAETASRAYYVIGFSPQGEPDGRTHTVQLKVKRPAARLAWRRQFVRLRPSEVRERALRAAELVPELYDSMGLDLSFIPGATGGSGRIADLVLHVPPGRILFLPEEGGPTAHLEAGIVAIDDEKKETMRLSRIVQVALKNDVKDRAAIGLDLFHRVRLPAGPQEITAVVTDLSAGSVSAFRLSAPGVTGASPPILGLSLYSLAEKSLWVEVGPSDVDAEAKGGVGDDSIGPSLKRRFLIGEPIVCGFKLAEPRGKDAARMRIAIRREEQVLESVDVTTGSDDPQRPMDTRLPVEGLAPGDYLVAVQEIVAGRAVDRATISFSLRPQDEPR
jgi:VWFA-related protein